ncbi:hypothetical protein IQ224_03260 [Microcystis sp. LEGE 00066]|uniref:Similarity. Hypothetical start n=1 Tax=Microcystis aeruginosa (strain PCC 7806) TaxID=267872 RepID=A8YGS1_MICA7|nr:MULTISPECIES: hypothetical protein [Microcystis]TRU03225.1 MAG: hypothetical protein EWV61_09360 [Microcystis aeruginosa Ma_AC_P_19900807_S300]ELS49552.1 hypothetical protein C789_678 [Microcystis aeruginosa FACHB-905 = DIANCHI905]MBE9261278.1 hypothetical protein [Microcystis sp. LEGE 00066]UGS07848.1 hypothetical protein LRR78_16620 [Microcystis aeruginosa FACHB-905 = DIANCHI905]WKX63851.1 hypothetical protein Q3H53_004020 [Microcystis aeruginosa PCC 7806]
MNELIGSLIGTLGNMAVGKIPDVISSIAGSLDAQRERKEKEETFNQKLKQRSEALSQRQQRPGLCNIALITPDGERIMMQSYTQYYAGDYIIYELSYRNLEDGRWSGSYRKMSNHLFSSDSFERGQNRRVCIEKSRKSLLKLIQQQIVRAID